MSDKSPAAQLLERVLVGTVEAIARAGAKAAESLASDAKKVLRNEALKAELLEKGVEAWRKAKLGEVDDLPESLRGDNPSARRDVQ